ncbi:MAG: hypothetical protein EAZ81_08100, partial [Verrucomicrobia bacterium]
MAIQRKRIAPFCQASLARRPTSSSPSPKERNRTRRPHKSSNRPATSANGRASTSPRPPQRKFLSVLAQTVPARSPSASLSAAPKMADSSVGLSRRDFLRSLSVDILSRMRLSRGVPAKHNIRRAAQAALHAWGQGHDYAETLVERHAQRYQLSPADRGLLHAILFGVLRHRRVLDHWISEMRRGKLDMDARDLLRIGLFQVLILHIADHAAVNETVEAGKANIRGLLNAVLRRAVGQKTKWLESLDNLPPAELHSHPDWLFKRWRKHYGLEQAIAIMEWNQQPAENFARYNPLSAQECPLESPLDGVDGFYHIEGPV